MYSDDYFPVLEKYIKNSNILDNYILLKLFEMFRSRLNQMNSDPKMAAKMLEKVKEWSQIADVNKLKKSPEVNFDITTLITLE